MRPAVVFPALAVAALGVTIQNVIFFRSTSAPVTAGDALLGADAGTDGEAIAPEETAMAPLARAELAAYLRSLSEEGPARSPFHTALESRQLVPSGLEPADVGPHLPSLGGILWSPARRVAWLDGVPRSEGEEFAGLRIERIARDAVFVSSRGETLELEVGWKPHEEGNTDEP